MSASDLVVFEPFYLPSTTGRLFSIFVSPAGRSLPEKAVLCAPAFGDEMNKSRRQVMLQARRLASLGCGMLIVDLFGTGDSEGDSADARWEIWLDNLGHALEWLEKRGLQRVSLLGIRVGALLAVDLIQRTPMKFERLVLWQPVINGAAYVKHILRLRIAAGLLSDGKIAKSDDVHALLESGEIVEYAGYALHPQLILEMEHLDLREEMLADCVRMINWLDVVPDDKQTMSPASKQVIQKWRQTGIRLAAQTVQGPSFWISPEEIMTCPFLVEVTANALLEESV